MVILQSTITHLVQSLLVLTLSKPSILMVNILHFLFEGDLCFKCNLRRHFQILIAIMNPVELCKEKEDLCKSKQTLAGQQ